MLSVMNMVNTNDAYRKPLQVASLTVHTLWHHARELLRYSMQNWQMSI